MRLIDQILAAAASDEFGHPPNWGALNGLATLIRLMKPQCFEISPSVVRACSEVFRSRPSSILSGMSHIRLPYSAIWLERVGEESETTERSRYADGQPKPSADRVGCFLMSTHLSSIAQMVSPEKRDAFADGLGKLVPELKEAYSRAMAVWAWSFKMPGEPINVCPLSIAFDWRQELPNAGMYVDGAKPEDTSQWPQYVSDPQELEAIRHLTHRRTILANPISFHFWEATQFPLIYVNKVPGTIPQFGVNYAALDRKQRMVMNSLVDDLAGEDALIVSFLLMLNSPTILSTKREDLRHLNEVRVKRGKPPLKDFIITELRLPKHLARHFEKSDVDRAQARMHMVRGHFKIRKTGVFWWTPYLWGKGRPEVKREKYATKIQ